MNFYAVLLSAIFTLLAILPAHAELRTPEDPGFIEPDQRESRSPSQLEGTWELGPRRCSSGAAVRDNFIPGRDLVELTFRGSQFRSFGDVAGCQTHSSGYFQERGPYLIMDIDRQSSTCGPAGPPARVTYRYGLRGDRLRIEVGPVNGGPCPAGDIFSFIYTRL